MPEQLDPIQDRKMVDSEKKLENPEESLSGSARQRNFFERLRFSVGKITGRILRRSEEARVGGIQGEPITDEAVQKLGDIDIKARIAQDRIVAAARHQEFIALTQNISPEERSRMPFGIAEDPLTSDIDGYGYERIEVPEYLKVAIEIFEQAMSQVRVIILNDRLQEGGERSGKASIEYQKALAALNQAQSISQERGESSRCVNEGLGRSKFVELLINAAAKGYSVREKPAEEEGGQVISLHGSIKAVDNVLSVSAKEKEIRTKIPHVTGENKQEFTDALFKQLNDFFENEIIKPIIAYITASTNAGSPVHDRVLRLGLPVTRARKLVEQYLYPLLQENTLNQEQSSLYEQRVGEVKELFDYYHTITRPQGEGKVL